MTAFFRFPRTPHIAWLGSEEPRNDKVLSAREVRDLLANDVVVEEKIDGANLGLSKDAHGQLRAQNRGTYLDLGACHGQWKPLNRWLAAHRRVLTDVLAPGLILFGEWCYAVHSVRYMRLPDWFLAFDVYDRVRGEFWSADRRNELARRLDMMVVPELGRGRFNVEGLKRLLGHSHLTDGPAEGLYVRREEGGRLVTRAKLVRADFLQTIHQHWSKRRLEENQVDAKGGPRP